ncbi:MAG: hypothetical protein K8W52_05925 [Deltaproteobacteria bacterium]|nr:hypothetical protein [Deltaproteobacteria bacterium]
MSSDAASGGDGGVVASTDVTVIVEPNGNGGAELRSAIAAATTSVYVTLYQLDDSKLLDALVARQAAGLDVQVILDGSSTNRAWNQPAYDQLHTAGVDVVWSNPAFTYTHAKYVILDGRAAWIMTMNGNISSPRYNREYLAIDTGAADVAEVTAIFHADHAAQPITPTGDLVVANTNARPRLVALIDAATTTVDLEDETFSDTTANGIVAALERAAHRGVRVRVAISNQTLSTGEQSANARVIAAGGHVVMTGPTSGSGTASNPYIHAKAILVDCAGTTCARGFVGSENMTANSLGYNREVGVILADPVELAKVATAFATDYARGTAL